MHGGHVEGPKSLAGSLDCLVLAWLNVFGLFPYIRHEEDSVVFAVSADSNEP